jgi:hypothetical protein
MMDSGTDNIDPSGLMEMLEKNYGVEKLWGWVCEWVWESDVGEPDEHIKLAEYLCLRAENDDEDIR